jgi:hypothetical protein
MLTQLQVRQSTTLNVSKLPLKKVTVKKNLLRCRRDDLKMGLNVTAEYACFEGFDMTTNVCLGRQEVAFVHIAVFFLVPIWHNDMSTESLYLNTLLMKATSERLDKNVVPSGVSRTTFHCPF